MKKILLLLLIFLTIKSYAQSINSINKIIVHSKHIKSCYFEFNDSTYDIKRINQLNIFLNEPLRILIKNSKNNNYLFFYIEEGNHIIDINLDNKIVSSKTSIIVQENNEVLTIKKYYDSLSFPIEITMRNTTNTGIEDSNRIVFDNIRKLYHKAYYNWCVKHPKSFISLRFLMFLSNDIFVHSSVGITKEEINFLFNSLDASLYKYPSYQECLKNMDEIINNPKYKLAEPPKPLWNPNQK